MKKLVFAAIAAMVLVSVSSAFAGVSFSANGMVEPTDTVAPKDTVNAPASLMDVEPTDTVAPKDTTAAPTPAPASLMEDTTTVPSAPADTTVSK